MQNMKTAKQIDGGFDLISKLHPCVTDAHVREGFEFNKDANTYICQAGHAAMRCGRCYIKKEDKFILTYFFSKVICKKCPLAAKCNLPPTSYSFDKAVMRESSKEQLEFQDSEHFKLRYRQRYKVEAKNAEAKQFHGLSKADSKGIHAMNVQSYFTAFALNLKRIVKLQTVKAI